jgi:hypothetical protein
MMAAGTSGTLGALGTVPRPVRLDPADLDEHNGSERGSRDLRGEKELPKGRRGGQNG